MNSFEFAVDFNAAFETFIAENGSITSLEEWMELHPWLDAPFDTNGNAWMSS